MGLRIQQKLSSLGPIFALGAPNPTGSWAYPMVETAHLLGLLLGHLTRLERRVFGWGVAASLGPQGWSSLGQERPIRREGRAASVAWRRPMRRGGLPQ